MNEVGSSPDGLPDDRDTSPVPAGPPVAGGSAGSSAAPPGGGPAAHDTPWIETPEGGRFFLNAVLVAPEFCVLVPLTVRTLLRMLGLAQEPSVFLDTIPFVAAAVLPRVGWLLVVPLALSLRARRHTRSVVARRWLAVFALSHAAFLVYTVLSAFGAV
ncbi:MAG: hypothetical protein D6701_15305 [Gemmatimonadetes bacterium]|nr:MAG: hypothetical protein D6701_15305 [Gemmatimonadota bacterium]